MHNPKLILVIKMSSYYVKNKNNEIFTDTTFKSYITKLQIENNRDIYFKINNLIFDKNKLLFILGDYKTIQPITSDYNFNRINILEDSTINLRVSYGMYNGYLEVEGLAIKGTTLYVAKNINNKYFNLDFNKITKDYIEINKTSQVIYNLNYNPYFKCIAIHIYTSCESLANKTTEINLLFEIMTLSHVFDDTNIKNYCRTLFKKELKI
jgi:hypothetical protein